MKHKIIANRKVKEKDKTGRKLPEFFRPLFWSYDFNSLDLEKNKKTIIIAAINYGDLGHWRWVKDYYGKTAVAGILSGISASELKPRAGRLAEILFQIKLNYASRSAH